MFVSLCVSFVFYNNVITQNVMMFRLHKCVTKNTCISSTLITIFNYLKRWAYHLKRYKVNLTLQVLLKLRAVSLSLESREIFI